jgi:hypothetical protein
MDILYVVYAIAQHFMPDSGYPPAKWRRTRPRFLIALAHIICGLVTIFSGTALTFILEHAPHLALLDTKGSDGVAVVTPLTKGLGYAVGVGCLLHAVTCIPMNTIPYGNRNLTVPMYFAATFVNFLNAITLLLDPTDTRQILNTWAGINIFVFVRLQLAVLFVRFKSSKLVLEPWYSFSQVSAAMAITALTQQNPYFFLLFAIPGPFSYVLRKIQFDFLKIPVTPNPAPSDEHENEEDFVGANGEKNVKLDTEMGVGAGGNGESGIKLDYDGPSIGSMDTALAAEVVVSKQL